MLAGADAYVRLMLTTQQSCNLLLTQHASSAHCAVPEEHQQQPYLDQISDQPLYSRCARSCIYESEVAKYLCQSSDLGAETLISGAGGVALTLMQGARTPLHKKCVMHRTVEQCLC